MAEPPIVVADDAAQPSLCRVAVRRGVGLGAEVGREVGGRHFYFVKRRARERADRADLADAGFDDVRRRELQTVYLAQCFVSSLISLLAKLSLEFLT